MAKMRTTTRGGRQGKAKHNDRTYLPEEERPRENRYSYVGLFLRRAKECPEFDI